MTAPVNPLDVQVGGDHYTQFKIQPVVFSEANGITFLAGCIIKRVCRYDRPTGKGVEDLKKVVHEIELFLHMRELSVEITSDLMPGAFSLDEFADLIGIDARRPVSVVRFIDENKFGNEVRGSLITLVALAAIADYLGRGETVARLMSAAWITVVGMLRLAGVNIQTGEPSA